MRIDSLIDDLELAPDGGVHEARLEARIGDLREDSLPNTREDAGDGNEDGRLEAVGVLLQLGDVAAVETDSATRVQRHHLGEGKGGKMCVHN